MGDEQRPLRQLKRLEELLVRFGRCPTCHKRLASAPNDQITDWNDLPGGIGKVYNGATATSFGRSRVGHITQLPHATIPHCAGCQHTFVHGWIYPAK